MATEKASVDEKVVTGHDGKGLHLDTLDADVNLDEMFGAERAQKEKALVRKVDMRMMPLMMVICKFPIA